MIVSFPKLNKRQPLKRGQSSTVDLSSEDVLEGLPASGQTAPCFLKSIEFKASPARTKALFDFKIFCQKLSLILISLKISMK